MGFSPLVNTLQFLQGVNARETCASFWTGRDELKLFELISPIGKEFVLYYFESSETRKKMLADCMEEN